MNDKGLTTRSYLSGCVYASKMINQDGYQNGFFIDSKEI